MIDLAANRLGNLPVSTRDLTQLEELYLHDNEGLGIPSEILGPDYDDVHSDDVHPDDPAEPATILDYYFRTLRGRRATVGVGVVTVHYVVPNP